MTNACVIFRANFAEDLSEIVTELWNRVHQLEGEKFDLERDFRLKAWEVICVCQRILNPIINPLPTALFFFVQPFNSIFSLC